MSQTLTLRFEYSKLSTFVSIKMRRVCELFAFVIDLYAFLVGGVVMHVCFERGSLTSLNREKAKDVTKNKPYFYDFLEKNEEICYTPND